MANFDPTAINPGKNFLLSKVTSPFLKQHKADDVKADLKNVEQIIKNGLRIVNPIKASLQIDPDLMDIDVLAQLEDFASSFGENIMNEVKNAGEQIVKDFTSKIAKDISKIPMDVTSKVASKVTEGIQDMLKEVIEELTTSAEERFEKDAEKQEEDAISKTISSITEQVTLISKIIEDTMAAEQAIISQIQRYPEQGAQFMQEQAQKQIDNAKNAATAAINVQYDKYKQKIEDWEDDMAERIAQKMKAKMKITITQQQKKLFDDIKKNVLIIKTNAHKILQVAKLQIMAMLGINLPI